MNINELMNRYNLKSRSTLYSRLKGLNITLQKDFEGSAFADDAQLKLLDDLDLHLKKGGNIANFTPSNQVTVLPSSDRQNSTNILKEPEFDLIVRSSPDSVQLNLFLELAGAIASKMKPHHSNYESLLFYAQNQIIISSGEVADLIGVKPRGQNFVRGSFRFVRSGKIGNQSAWLIILET